MKKQVVGGGSKGLRRNIGLTHIEVGGAQWEIWPNNGRSLSKILANDIEDLY